MAKKRYYVSGNTAHGFINLLPENIAQFEHTIILKHPSEKIKTAVLNDLINKYKQKYDLEILLSPLGSNYLDGVIIREQSFAMIIDNIAVPELTGAIELDLGLFISKEKNANKEFKTKFQSHTKKAYESFATGLTIHDDLEEIYIREMNFDRADELAEEFIRDLLKDKEKENRHVTEFKRMFGTNTPDGVVNVVPEIIAEIANVYYIKGRAGTGKSTFMNKIAKACENNGFDVEKYYCSFDPDSVDMVLVPGLDFCIFDSTDPHEFNPYRDGEFIVDLYDAAVTPGTDEKYAADIQATNDHYKSYMKKGIQHLKEAGRYLELIENQYVITEEERKQITTFIQENIMQ